MFLLGSYLSSVLMIMALAVSPVSGEMNYVAVCLCLSADGCITSEWVVVLWVLLLCVCVSVSVSWWVCQWTSWSVRQTSTMCSRSWSTRATTTWRRVVHKPFQPSLQPSTSCVRPMWNGISTSRWVVMVQLSDKLTDNLMTPEDFVFHRKYDVVDCVCR